MDHKMILQLREPQITNGLLFCALLCLALIALARLNKERLFVLVLQGFKRLKWQDQLINEQERIENGTALVLILNFLISGGLTIFQIIRRTPCSNVDFYLLLGIPLFILLYWKSGQWLITLLVGKHEVTRQIKFNTRFSFFFGGFLFLGVAIFSLLNVKLLDHLPIFALVVFIILLVTRILKGIWSAYLLAIPWYYIILYLCTLELLPMLVLFGLYGSRFSSFVK